MKSIITCDLEGTILTMNEDAEKIFGYKKDELIGKKRVSIFSPGEIVLQNVAEWLSTAVKKGVYNGETYFLNKNKEKINAKIKITPTFSQGAKGDHIGYCGITEVIEKEVDVPIKMSTKLIKGLAITRMPFTSASLLPVFAIGAYFAYQGDGLFNISQFIMTIFGILLAHLGMNVYNDYFDVKDGTDEENAEYFQQVSGGSRAIELGLISLKGTKNLATTLLLASLLIGGLILYNMNINNINHSIIIIIAALFLGYFYTGRPLRLVARRGLGELAIFLAFGPLLTIGTGLAIYNGAFIESKYFMDCLYLGIPLGLLTTNILLINEFPDMRGDAKTNKNHLVVTFGKKASRWIYLSILILFGVSSIWIAYLLSNTFIAIGSILCLLYGMYIFKNIYKNYDTRELASSNWSTIYLHTFYSIIICICMLVSESV